MWHWLITLTSSKRCSVHGGFRRLERIGRATCMQVSNEPIAFMNAYLVVVALYLVYVFRFTVTEDIRTQDIWYHATATFAMSFYIRQWRFVLITRHMLGGATNQPIDTSVSNGCGFQCVALLFTLRWRATDGTKSPLTSDTLPSPCSLCRSIFGSEYLRWLRRDVYLVLEHISHFMHPYRYVLYFLFLDDVRTLDYDEANQRLSLAECQWCSHVTSDIWFPAIAVFALSFHIRHWLFVFVIVELRGRARRNQVLCLYVPCNR